MQKFCVDPALVADFTAETIQDFGSFTLHFRKYKYGVGFFPVFYNNVLNSFHSQII